MSGFTLKSWSEQQQVAAVILLAALVIALPCYRQLPCLAVLRKRAVERLSGPAKKRK